ncbi:MAG: c-type cytochrome domain-containing protein [Planctomycetota bacterium]
MVGWLVVGFALGSYATAQDDRGTRDGARLQKLLQELAATDASAWAARQTKLEAEAKAHEQEAKTMRQQAESLQRRADAEDATARELRQRLDALRKVQALVAAWGGQRKDPAQGGGPAGDGAKEGPPPTGKAVPVVPPAAKPAMPNSPPAEGMPANDAKDEELVTWRNRIEDLLGERCAGCHDQDSKKGGLDVTSFAAVREGGSSGNTLVPGEPDQSRLYRLVAHEERPFMPKDEDRLPAAAIAALRRWIEQGASEDEAGARAFLAAKAKTAATATSASDARDAGPAPWPQGWPTVELRTFEHPGVIKSLARSPRAGLLALPGHGQVVLLDTELAPVGVLASELDQVELVGFSPDGATLFAAGGERGKRGQIEIFDLRSGQCLGRVGKERDTPLAAAVSSARDLVALAGSGKYARAHGIDGTLSFAAKHDDFVLSLAVSSDGKLLAAADRSGVIRVYTTRGGRLEQTLTGHAGAVNAVAFLTDTRIASAGADGTVRLWDAAAGRELWRQNAHAGEALAVATGPDARIASAGSDGRVRVFAANGKPLAQSPPVGEWLYAVAFGTTGDTVLAGDWRGRLHRYDLKAKRIASTVPLGPAQ